MATWTVGVVRAAVAAAAAAAGLSQPAVAHAEPAGDAALIWQAPGNCPDAAEVRARIERRLGASVGRLARGIQIDVEVSRDGGVPRFVARIDLRGVAGRDEVRVLTSARCDELTDAVAVVVARIATEASQPPAELRADHPSAPSPPPVAPRAWGAGLRVMGISGIGVVPGVGVAGELAGYLRARSLVVELAGTRWLPSPHFLQPEAPGHVEVSLAAVALRVGWGPEHLPLRAWLEGELGAMDGKGISLDEPRIGHARWIGAGAGFAVAWPMTPHARLVGTIELVVPVQQARFVLQDGSEIYRPGVATARSGLGLEVGWR
jgi:hypothetical protein